MILSEATDTRYDIVKLLGQGASATVYLARHIALGELRVLKILHHDMMLDARRREKFKLEAQVAAHLKHPAIVQVFDVTQTESKLQIEMEYIEGLSLRQYLERRREFPLSVAIAILHAVLEGMEHAHKARLTFGDTVFDGVIHRDLKPENIMVRKNGQPVICDFGVAKVGADLMTQTQHISGSVAYMAPERLRGELSTRSIDVFALGVMLFELHKGFRPFGGRNKTQVIENILKWNIADLDAVWKGSDEAVLQIVKKALARDPSQRYQDAGQMLAALRPLYKLYHGDAAPASVILDYLTRGRFTTAEFRALMPEETPWRARLLKVLAVACVAGAGIAAWRALSSREGAGRPAADEALGGVPAATGAAVRGPDAAAPGVRASGPESGNMQATPAAAPSGSGTALGSAPVTRPEAFPAPGDEARIRALPEGERQNAYFLLASAAWNDRRDAAAALLLATKALDYAYHPTIALLKAEILQAGEMYNLAGAELAHVKPWVGKLSGENQARYYWLLIQQQYLRGEPKGKAARVRARNALRRYLSLRPPGAEENLKLARERLGSLP